MESVTHTAPGSFGHVIVKEQITTTYHQENYCDISGPKEQVARIGACAKELISLESSTISSQISSEIMEKPLESFTEREMLSKGPQVMSSLQNSGSQVKFCLEQDANYTLYSIREDHAAVDKNLTLERKNDHQSHLFIVDKPALGKHKEAHRAEEKKPCESLLSTDNTVADTQLRASVNSGFTSDPIPCTDTSSPKVDRASVYVMDTPLPIELPLYLENGLSETTWNRSSPQMSTDMFNFDVSHQSHSSQQYHCSSEASCSNVPPLLGSRGIVNSESLEDKEVPSELTVLSHPQTSPPCRGITTNLPMSNSERPANLPNVRGRSFLEQDQETSSSTSVVDFFSCKSSSSSCDTSSSIPSRFLESKPQSAFSFSLRMRSPSPNTSSSINSSALAKSLAASCISQTISQSMAKMNARIQAASPPVISSSLHASTLRLRSPSPKSVILNSCIQSDCSSLPAKVSQITRSLSSPSCSNSLRSSPATVQSPPPFCSQHLVSPSSPVHSTLHTVTHTRADLEHSPHTRLNSNNNNNNELCNTAWTSSYKTSSATSGSQTYRAAYSHDPYRGTSHNRIARPFLSSEPNSRVQSPSPSHSPSMITRIHSPPLVPSSASPLITKPPNPRTIGQGGASPFTPLSLELSQTNSACILSPCASPRVTSPPPIGIPTNIWCIVSPQPRNPLVTPSFPTIADATSKGSRITSPVSRSSPCSLFFSPNQRAPKGSSLPFENLTGSPPNVYKNEHRSFAENGQWAMDVQSHPTSPQMQSCNGFPLCVTPQPQSPITRNAGKTTDAEKHLTHFNWPEVYNLPTTYNTEDMSQCNVLPSSSCHETEQEDSELGKATCRSSLICAYVAQTTPAPEKDTYSQCSNDRTQVDNLPIQGIKTPLKASYATTVNLQIAGSGRIASFSNAQVSLTQTLAPVTESQGMRRVSINGCTLSIQNCKRL